MKRILPPRRISWQARPLHLVLAAGLVFAAAPGASADSAAGGSTKLTISYSEKVADELALWIAGDAGYFKKRGLDVTEIYLPAQEGIPGAADGTGADGRDRRPRRNFRRGTRARS